MPVTAATAVAVAAVLDAVVGEPPNRLHPVAWFGRAVGAVDRAWRSPTLAGALAALGLPLAAAAGVAAAVYGATLFDPALGAAVAGGVLATTASLRALLAAARRVLAVAASDPAAARRDLRALVGREAGSLSPSEVRSAVVESLAENLADGLVAPLLAFAALAPVSLALGAAAAAWVRAVDTMDSMLGYPGQRIGAASARLDDLVMWLPARLTAGLLAAAAGDPGAAWRARESARRPASPNSGWPMATLAAALGVRLAKPDHYALDGGRALPSPAAAARAVRVVAVAGGLAFALSGVLAWR